MQLIREVANFPKGEHADQVDLTAQAPPGWTVTGDETAVQYDASGGFPTAAVSTQIGGGSNFFAGGNSETSTATQTVNVSAAATNIDAAQTTATLSADLGGFDHAQHHLIHGCAEQVAFAGKVIVKRSL